MAAQVEWSETGEWDNPALAPLVSTLRRTYGDDLIHLATEGTRCIRDVVAASLHRDCGRHEHLRFLTDVHSGCTADPLPFKSDAGKYATRSRRP
jgi:hypothetical protein